MPAISSGDLALLRQQHQAKFYLTPHPATVLWGAQVAGAHTREDTTIAFDGGSGANFAAITAGMELWIGTSAGAYDVDRLRIKSVSSGDSGTTGTVTVADNSVIWADNQHLTFIGWFLVHPKRPNLGNDGTFYKDGSAATGGIIYSDQNSEPTPVCIAGENRANFLDPDTGTWVIASQLPGSYAIANGATISSYGASLVYGPDTPAISINSGTGVGTITFDTAGLYWIAYTVTDSNGKSQVTYRWYYAHSTNPQSAHYPLTNFAINNIQGSWNNGGWSAGINVHGDVDLDTIPDYAPCIVWSENWYGSTKKNITFLPDQSGTIVGGYIRKDQFAQDIEKGAHVADFSITTIQGASDNKYNFSVSLEAAQTVDTWWKYPSWITPARAVHHFFKWHSTILEVCDVIGLNTNTDGDSHVDFPDGTLFERANGPLAVVRSRLVCDGGGRVHFVEDVQLRPDAERSGLAQVQEIEDLDKNGEIGIVRQFEKRVPFVYLAAFDYDGGFDGEGNPAVESRCAIAPGNNAYEDGPQPATEGRQIVTDQTHANQIVGRFLHAENNEYPEVRVPMLGRLGVLPVHLSEFWEYTTLSGDTARKITVTLNLILRQVTATINVSQGTVACIATFEAESNGPAGIATACPSFPDLPDTDFEIPDPESELPGALMTGSSIDYLPPQSKTWEERSNETIQDAYADPHWRIKQQSNASKDAIIWRCGTGYIKRSEDAGLTWDTVTPGDLPSGIVFIRGEGNYIVDGEHVFIGRWQDGDDWLSRIYITSDDGQSWAEQDIGEAIEESINVATSSTVSGHAPSRVLIEMSSTRILVSHVLGTGPRITLINSQNKTVLDHLGFDNIHIAMTACRLSNTVLATVFLDFDASTLRTRVFDITGDEFTLVGTLAIDTGFATTVTAIEPLDEDRFLIAYRGASGHGKAVVCTYTPGGEEWETVTAGTIETFNEADTPYIAMCQAEGSLGAAVQVVYANGTDSLKCVRVATAGTTVNPGTHFTLDEVEAKFISAAQLDDNKFITSYVDASDDTGYITVNTVAAGSITIGTPVDFRPSADISATSVTAQSATIAYVAYIRGIQSLSYKQVTISGHTPSLGDEVDFAGTGTYPAILWSSQGLVYMFKDTSNNLVAVFTAGGGGEFKALGMSIGKGAGEIVYVTGWDGTGLVLLLYSLPDLVLIDNISLGAASEAQVNANTWTAKPYSPFGSDQACYVYGRMDDPLATGTAHILLTEDEGLSFIEIEQGWGSNFCGAVLEDYGRIMAIRNLASSSKLYVGDVGSALKVASTLPFAAQVNPMALVFDYSFGALYVGSASSDEFMIVISPEPDFHKFYDLTFNHPTTNGIRSIIIL